MTKTIRILEVDPVTLVVKEPRLGANGSVEVFALEDSLASEVLRFVETGETLDSILLDAIVEIDRWQTLLSRRSECQIRVGYADLNLTARRALAAQYLRMRHEDAKLHQIEGLEVAADHELHWHMGRVE
jgi:hypothetical protein